MPVMASFPREVLAGSTLDMASPIVRARGVAYSREGRVELMRELDSRVEATVRGSMPYRVALWVDGATLRWACSCPFAEGGAACKHVVAVMMDLGASQAVETARETGQSDDDVAGYVTGLDHDRLVDLVLQQASSDWSFRQRLEAEARSARGATVNIRGWKRRIDAAFSPYGEFVPYAEARGWATGIGEVIDTLDALIDVGQADAVIGLAEYAHRRADEAMGNVDDSDGWLSGISEHLGDLHRRACVAATPDPVELAGRLLELELTSELDAFHRAAVGWADVLGSDGIDEYRRLVEPRFTALGADATWSEEFAVRQARIGVALAAGDPDELIEVFGNDLRTPDAYLEIARALDQSKRREEAIERAETGLRAFADRSWHTPPLREYLADMLRRGGDKERSVQVFWEAYAQHPTLDTFRRLGAEAEDAGSVRDWRAEAIEWLRTSVIERDVEDSHSLVEILLFEGEAEEAWEIATRHGCDKRLWLKLAGTREEHDPLDAVDVYEREIHAQIDTKKNRGYRTAAELLEKVKRLSGQAGQPERFRGLISSVRSEHGRKRNLMALFETKGW